MDRTQPAHLHHSRAEAHPAMGHQAASQGAGGCGCRWGEQHVAGLGQIFSQLGGQVDLEAEQVVIEVQDLAVADAIAAAHGRFAQLSLRADLS